MKRLHHVPNNNDLRYSLKPSKEAFGGQNVSPWEAYGRTESHGRPFLIFEGCTVRFAWFCNRRPLIFAPRSSPRRHFFTDSTNSLSESAKCGPKTPPRDAKTLLASLRIHPETISKTGHRQKSFFAPGTPQSISCFLAPGP